MEGDTLFVEFDLHQQMEEDDQEAEWDELRESADQRYKALIAKAAALKNSTK